MYLINKFISPSQETQSRMSLQDYDLGLVIGEGSFSLCRLARRRSDGKLFAMKIVSKAHVFKLGKVAYVQQERNILTSLIHPNIIRLYCCFHDERFLYFVLELASFGDLQMLIKQNGPLPLPVVKLYTSQLVSALCHLREKKVIHRDLKPANVLISDDMTLKLTDFGTAKKDSQNDSDTPVSPSFAGSALYVPPEMLEGGQFSYATDLWSLGCIIFEMLTGRSPFNAKTDYLTFQLILTCTYTFPPSFDEDTKCLVRSLLKRHPEERLGFKNLQYLTNHRFFSDLDNILPFR
ncbi:hypothetical protein GEMRC1_010121 [Eukaryota sp. GEM-RC1]